MDVSKSTAVIFFNRGHYEDAVCILQILVNEQMRQYGPNSARTLQTRSLIVAIRVVQKKYAEALKILLDIYSRKLKVLGLQHPSTRYTRKSIINLLKNYGTANVVSQAMQDIVKIFRYLKKMTRKKFLNGQYKEALIDSADILDDMTRLLGWDNLITLDMGSLVAIIYSTSEKYDASLEMLDDIYDTKRRTLGVIDRRLVSTLMKKAYVLLKMCNFEKAMECYCKAYNMRKSALGHQHRKTLVSIRYIAEVAYTVGNYEEALSLLTEVARVQEHHNYRELIFTKIHIGNLEFARGNYDDALSIFRDISIDKRTPNRIKAMIQNKKGVTLTKLGRYHEARIILKDACDTIQLTNFHAETLITYRNLAVLLAKEGKVITAEAMFNILIATCLSSLHTGHSVGFSIASDQGEFYFSRGRLDEALNIFTKLWICQSRLLGQFHPSTLHAKCQVAKVLKEHGKYDEALRMYNEVLAILKSHFYHQHPECLDVENQIASIYLYRNSYVAAFQIYYKHYEFITMNYEADHPLMIEIIEKMQTITDRVPTMRLIETTLKGNMFHLKSFLENGDDVNARDVKGAVTLHHASRQGKARILKYLLNKGAIYDIKDMIGNTPESISANYETKFVFLLVKRLFECIENSDLQQVQKILRKERLIINARDSARRTPLQRAVIKGHGGIVNVLIFYGADISLGAEDDGNVLHMAAARGHAHILEILLRFLRNINLDLFRDLIDSTDNVMGATPLHLAAKNDRVGCVKVLIKYTANPMIRDILNCLPYDLGKHTMQKRILTYALNLQTNTDFFMSRNLSDSPDNVVGETTKHIAGKK